MVERRGVAHEFAHARFRVASEIVWHGDQTFHAQVTVSTQLFEHGHIIPPAQEQRVVDRHQPAAIRYKRAHFVDQACPLCGQVHRSHGRSGEEWRVEENAIEAFLRPFQAADNREKITTDEILFVDWESVQRV